MMTNGQRLHGWRSHVERALLLPVLALLALTILAGLPAATAASFTVPGNEADVDLTGYWSPVPSPTDHLLVSVDTISSDDGWAVGEGGVILHWNGVAWDEASSPTTECLMSVSMLSSDLGCAVGSNDAILGWNGSSWQESWSLTRGYDLTSVSVISATEVWAVGTWAGASVFDTKGVILHWDDAPWQQEVVPYDLYAVDMVSPDDGWIGGTSYAEAMPSEPVLLHWDGASWQAETGLPSEISSIRSIAMVSTDDGWAAGIGGIMHWDGESWELVPELQGKYLSSVDMVSANNGWAVAFDGSIAHWNGISWQSVYSPTGAPLYSVSMVSGDDGWIVGYGGTILHYWIPDHWSYLPVLKRESD